MDYIGLRKIHGSPADQIALTVVRLKSLTVCCLNLDCPTISGVSSCSVTVSEEQYTHLPIL